MKKRLFIIRLMAICLTLVLLFLFIGTEIAEARRGGGFGRMGRSFGGRRSYTPRTYRTPGQQRTMPTRPRINVPPTKRSSFGGTRLNSAQNYTSRYGVPRKVESLQGRNAAGLPQNYVVHNYGGYGSSLMTGYLLGTTNWMWMMPFHPAFYYSRPYEVANPDGTISVYPPTFSFGRLLFTLFIVGSIIYIIYRIIRSRKMMSSRAYSQSSFV